jgi:hypothetical protein
MVPYPAPHPEGHGQRPRTAARRDPGRELVIGRGYFEATISYVWPIGCWDRKPEQMPHSMYSARCEV